MTAELEAALDLDPYDSETLAVYGDWLQQRGDPRGTLAALQAATAWQRGCLPDLLAFEAAHPELMIPGCRGRLSWAYGFVRRAEVAIDEVEALLAHPSTRFLPELAIRLDVELRPQAGARPHPEVEPIVHALHRARRPLRLLEIDGDRGRFAWLGDIDLLSRAAPRLERLSLAGNFHAQHLALPHLRSLRVGSFRMQPSQLRVLREAAWPALIELAIHVGACARAVLRELAALLVSTELPGLDTLRLSHGRGIGFALDRARGSQTLRHLRVLDLAFCEVTDAYVDVLATRCRHLERLDVTGHELTPIGLRQMRAIAKQVIA